MQEPYRKGGSESMYALEKPDCAVVPVSQPNKGGQPSAEIGEGRAQTKENIVRKPNSYLVEK
jgi:hypothetical protein